MPQSKVIAPYEDANSAKRLRAFDAQRLVAQQIGKAFAELEVQVRRLGLLARLTKRKPEPVRGDYLWPGVGRGKSMLMDLFYNCFEIAEKRCVHLHQFMLEVVDRLHLERAKEPGKPIMPVANAIAAEARLFARIIGNGVTVVATSNRPPQGLYRNGLNRAHFLSLIALLDDRPGTVRARVV